MDTESHQIPEAVVEVLNRHVVILIEVLGRDLTGVYLHGSAAIGGFSFQQSDIDYVALVADPLRPSERQALAQRFLEGYGDGFPAKGVEMSIVLERYAGVDFRYPTPYFEIQPIAIEICGDGTFAAAHYIALESVELIKDRPTRTGGSVPKDTKADLKLRFSDFLAKENDHWLVVGAYRDGSCALSPEFGRECTV